jgi:pimeloyl-ACP methyl ester carboxylesterase
VTITNTLNIPSPAWRRGKRVLGWIGRGLAALVGFIVVLALAGASYEAIAASDRPLIVLASEQNMTATPYWDDAQRRQAALSTNGHLIVPPDSVHYIHWEQPTLVIDAVRQVVEDVRSR